MAINGLVAKLSVVVSFSDNTSKQILAALDEKGNVSVNSSVDHEDTALHVSEDTVALSSLGVELAPTELTSLSAAVTAIAVATEVAKTVNDLVFEVSGRVANDDNTQGDFALQYLDVSGTSIWRSAGGDVQNFVDALENTTTRALLVSLFATAGLTLTIS